LKGDQLQSQDAKSITKRGAARGPLPMLAPQVEREHAQPLRPGDIPIHHSEILLQLE